MGNGLDHGFCRVAAIWYNGSGSIVQWLEFSGPCRLAGRDGRAQPWEEREMLQLTPMAVTKVKEILSQQAPSPAGLRVAVVGAGCSGFSYHMAFENQINEGSDNVYEFEGLKVLVDQMSEMYLEGVSIDYLETLEGSGFKFNNPNVKSTCGCGSSFST